MQLTQVKLLFLNVLFVLKQFNMQPDLQKRKTGRSYGQIYYFSDKLRATVVPPVHIVIDFFDFVL